MTKEIPFCSRPFLELMLSYEGEVFPCCLLENYSLGKIEKKSLNEFWNSDKLKALREEFLTGNIKTCQHNIETKSCHKFFSHFDKLVERKAHQSDPLKRLDLRLNGKCNLECIMCNVWMGENGKYDGSTLWSEGPSEIFPHLLEISMLGGEPFIQPDTFKLIDEVSKVNSNCRWEFTTNANWNFQGRIKSYLDKINIGMMTVSMDAILPDTYFRIRRKGDFKQSMKTINDLILYRDQEKKDLFLRLDFVVQTFNLQEVLAFYKFCLKKKVDPSFILLEQPRELSIANIDSPALQKIAEELKPHIEEEHAFALKNIYLNIEKIIASRN